MQIFSHEHLSHLQDELKLLNRTLGKMQLDVYFIRTFGAQPTATAINSMMIRRIELEATIETLNEYLNG